MMKFLKPNALFLSCLLLTSVAAAQPQTLTLKEADIRTLISTVSELTGKNFVVDPRVTGNVTVISAKPIDSEALYEVFLSVLQVHGFSAVESGQIIHIVPDAVAVKSGIQNDPSHSLGSSALVTRVIALNHISADEITSVLRPMISTTGLMSTHSGSNSLILTERQGNIERMISIIRRIDKTSDESLEILPLQNASASELQRTLKRFTEKDSKGNSLNILVDERTNTLILSGPKAKRLKVRAVIAHLDTPLQGQGNTQVIYLNYANAQELVPILEGLTRENSSQSNETNVNAKAQIFAHQSTNSLVVTASSADFRNIRSVVQQLDIPRAQVLVEAIVAEVSEEKAQELGVQWQVSNDLDGEGAVGGTNFTSDGNNILRASGNPLGVGQGLNLGYLNGQVTLPGSDTAILQLGALVHALSSDSDTNILSTPNIVTLDNEEASFQVGQEVPFLTGQYSNTGASESAVNPFQTIKREDVGLKLAVTPHVNEGDAVILDIDQEISSLANSVGAVDLVTNKRTLKTTVMIPDGKILVLGGLISDDVQESVSKVPVLGSIPVLGNLFKHKKKQHIRRNLMVFIRPVILKDQRIMDQVTHGKYQLLRNQNLKEKFGSSNLTEGGGHPLLPELEKMQLDQN